MTRDPRPSRDEDRLEALDVLIADADPDEVARIREGLRDLHNRIRVLYEPDQVADLLAHRGSYAEERRTPDLVIVDRAMLGGGACWTFIRELRRQDRFDDTAFAILVPSGIPARQKSDILDRALEAGGKMWVTEKPVTLASIRKLIEDLEGMGLSLVRYRRTPTPTGAAP